MRRPTATASAVVSAKTVMVSALFSEPPPETEELEMKPGVGLRPTMLLKAAGTRPDPAASLATEKEQRPAATETPEPELEPPEMKSSWNTDEQAP